MSINKSFVHQQGHFFVESPINFLGALIWWLKKFKNGKYCTLPHAIELAQIPYNELFQLLSAEPDLTSIVGVFVEAYKNKTMEMLDGQIASARIPLGRLASPDLYYVLTGNDLNLDINNSSDPKILCLGGDVSRQEALSPILSLYIDRLNRLINVPGRHPCGLVCDEFASVRAASVLNTVAVGRSNNIVPILVIQDVNQLKMQYSVPEANTIMNMTGSILCGQVGGETARWMSERFFPLTQHKKTVSINSNDTSISRSETSVPSITPATIANLSSGEFVGILADEPEHPIPLKAIHARLIKTPTNLDLQPLPIVKEITPQEINNIFLQVKKDVRDFVTAELLRISRDPSRKGRS